VVGFVRVDVSPAYVYTAYATFPALTTAHTCLQHVGNIRFAKVDFAAEHREGDFARSAVGLQGAFGQTKCSANVLRVESAAGSGRTKLRSHGLDLVGQYAQVRQQRVPCSAFDTYHFHFRSWF